MDVNSFDTIQAEIELKSNFNSFGYNNGFDKRIFKAEPCKGGFYLYGKLDRPFERNKRYQKSGESFFGFWVAKFRDDLTLEYFREVPFQNLNNVVAGSVIYKPSEIEVKPHLNGGLLISINELHIISYHNKYFFYLDPEGNQKMATGGLDCFHVMEYDPSAVRLAGKSTRVRVMNDDWSYYTNDAYLYV